VAVLLGHRRAQEPLGGPDVAALRRHLAPEQISRELERIERLKEAEALKDAASRSAIHNPVSEREAAEFFEEQKRQLADLISSQSFQAAEADSKEKWLAEKFKEQQRADEEKFDHVGEISEVDTLTTQDLVLHLAPGRYIFYCNLEGHYLGGMHGVLEVSDYVPST
jgi:hypothetical protein